MAAAAPTACQRMPAPRVAWSFARTSWWDTCVNGTWLQPNQNGKGNVLLLHVSG